MTAQTALTAVELAQRRERLAELLRAAPQMLGELAQVLDLAPEHDLWLQPHAAVPAVEDFLTHTPLAAATEDARIWLANRLALWLGACLQQALGGQWQVEARASARYAGRFVLGDMAAPVAAAAVVSPFDMAHAALREPQPVSQLLAQAMAEARASGGPAQDDAHGPADGPAHGPTHGPAQEAE